MNELAIIEQVLIGGDLAKLSTPARVEYYNRVCESLALNPLTKPFQYLQLNGKLILYATKDCTEQLRKRDSISISIVGRELVEGVYVVTARASNPAGRSDESIGAVSLDSLKGEARANALMKAETKAKRRVTLSFAGLGMLDESEVSLIPDARVVEMDAPTVRTIAAPATIEQPAGASYQPAIDRIAQELDAMPALFDEPAEPRKPRDPKDLTTCNHCGATIAFAPLNGRPFPYNVGPNNARTTPHECSGAAPRPFVPDLLTPAEITAAWGRLRAAGIDTPANFLTTVLETAPPAKIKAFMKWIADRQAELDNA